MAYPLPKISRFTAALRSDGTIAIPNSSETDFALQRRLEMETTQLFSDPPWKEMRAHLESEAVSKVAVKELINKLFSIAQELSGKAEVSVEGTAVFLLRLFIQKPVTSTFLKLLVKHVFGTIPSSVTLHRIYTLVNDVKAILPPYTCDYIQNSYKKFTSTKEPFGRNIKFVPMNKNKIKFPDVSQLIDALPFAKNTIIENNFDETVQDDVNEGHWSPELEQKNFKEYKHSVRSVHCRHFDNEMYEEVRFCTTTSEVEGLNVMTISDLSETVKHACELQNLNAIESLVYEKFASSKENILVSLPLGFDKTTLIILAVLSVINMQSHCWKSHKLKALYFVASETVAEQLAVKLCNRLSYFGIIVKSLTTTSNFNKLNLENIHILITTLSVWNASVGRIVEDDILKTYHLIMIDELGWLQEDNGPILEVLIARIKRLARNERCARIIGFAMSVLTLDCAPTFFDIAEFLQVDASNALVMSQFHATVVPNVSLINVKSKEMNWYKKTVNEICYKIVKDVVSNNQKVVVFVNSEDDVVHTAEQLVCIMCSSFRQNLDLPRNVINRLLTLLNEEAIMLSHKKLFFKGCLIIHSGMTASARDFVITMFQRGLANLIVTSSDFAWMLKNQADTVVIKETDAFSKETGLPVDVGISALIDMLTVAASPAQEDLEIHPGKVVISASARRFEHYMKMFKNDTFIESHLLNCLPDFLNSEISFGALSNIAECETWFRSTYLYHRMRNRSVDLDLGLDVDADVDNIISKALQALYKADMIRFLGSGNFTPTELCYTSVSLGICHASLEFLWKHAKNMMSISNTIEVMTRAPVFSHIQLNPSEVTELIELACSLDILIPQEKERAGSWKITVLLNAHFSCSEIENHDLQCDQNFIVKKMSNLVRAMFEVYVCKRNAVMANQCLELISKIEKDTRNTEASCESSGLNIVAYILPPSGNTFQVNISVIPIFRWMEELNTGPTVRFRLWIEDRKNNFICNHMCFSLNRKSVEAKSCLQFVLPVTSVEPLPNHLKVCVVNEKLMRNVQSCDVKHDHISRSDDVSYVPGLLALRPLPVSALQNKLLEEMYSFQQFSPVISQAFHSLYHKDCNILLTVPSAQQRFTAAEICIFRALCTKPGSKVVYLNPFRAEVEERLHNWQNIFTVVGWSVAAFTGNPKEDIKAFIKADVIVATTQHWEVAVRTREMRKCMKRSKVSLMILDELQVMDIAMEVIVSGIISSLVCNNVRIVGLSTTTLDCTKDIAHFLGVPAESSESIYNFGYSSTSTDGMSSARVFVIGFVQKCYATRMIAMSHAVWRTIQEHLKPTQSVVVLVPTQTEVLLTSQVLVDKAKNSSNKKRLLAKTLNENDICSFEDKKVKAMLEYGIGIVHSGMSRNDCEVMKTLINVQKIRVLVICMDMVNDIRTKNHLVIVKGTEYYGVAMEDYVEIPVREVAHKMYSCSNCWTDAVILTHDSRKALYHTYFQGALVVESDLLPVLPEYLNNEIAAGTVETKTSAVKLLSHSYLGHRLTSNPAYYLGPFSKQERNSLLSDLVEKSLHSLEAAGCVILRDSGLLQSTLLGSLCSLYNLSHTTLKHLSTHLSPDMTQEEMLLTVCRSHEFNNLHLKAHDEELIRLLEKHSRWKVDHAVFLPMVAKTFLLLQAHFSKLGSQVSSFLDFAWDTKDILDISYRIVQAVIVICSDRGWLKSALQAQLLLQMIVVGSWDVENDTLSTLPHDKSQSFKSVVCRRNRPEQCSNRDFSSYEVHPRRTSEIDRTLKSLPAIEVQLGLYGKVKFWILKELHRRPCRRNDMPLPPNKEYTLSVQLRETVEVGKAQSSGSWKLMFGIRETQKLVAMKRVGPGVSTALLTFMTCKTPGEVCYTLYILSDNHIGADQQFDINLKIAKV